MCLHNVTLCWHTLDIFESLQSDKLLDIQQMAHSLLWRQPVTVHQVMSFWARSPFAPVDMYNVAGCVVSFRVIC